MTLRFTNVLALTLGLSAFAAAFGVARSSEAFCRATTCVPSDREDCAPDEHGCLTKGVPLWWRRAQVDLVIDSAGSEFSAIDESKAFLTLSEALQSYSNVVCKKNDGGPRKAFTLSVLGSGGAAVRENGLNEVSFVDAGWQYDPSAIAHTWLSFDSDTGQILEADIELNSEDFTFATDAAKDQLDLQAVLTHEVGHVLGLGHTDVPDATMQPESSTFGVVDLRSLEADDEEGVCAVQADSWQAEPSAPDKGGCSVTSASPKGNIAVVWLAALGLALVVRRARTRTA